MKNIYIDSKKRTVNDTGKYALQINYVFGLFDTFEAARKVYDDVMSKWDSIDDSPYGVIGILSPNYRDPKLPGMPEAEQPLSELQAINIADYAVKNPARWDVRMGFKGGNIDKLAGKSALPNAGQQTAHRTAKSPPPCKRRRIPKKAHRRQPAGNPQPRCRQNCHHPQPPAWHSGAG